MRSSKKRRHVSFEPIVHTAPSGPVEKKQRRAASNDRRGDSMEPEKQQQPQPHKKGKRKQSNDPYSNMDASLAAALRRDDEEIAYLEQQLGMKTSSKEKKRLYQEYAKMEGYGDDFGEFLEDLDELVVRTTEKQEDDRERYEKLLKRVNKDDESSIDSQSDNEDDFDGGSEVDELEEYDEVAELTKISDPHEDSEGDEDSNSIAAEPLISRLNSDDEKGDSGDEDDEQDDDVDVRDEGQDSDDSKESDVADEDENEDRDDDARDHDARFTYRPITGEDIYGNKMNAPSSDSSPKKYVPPHLRNKTQDGIDENRQAALQSIQRSLNSALNRLSEDTLVSVTQTIAKLYSSHPTADMNECYWKNIREACVNRPSTMAGFIPVYVACAAGVHILTGEQVQFGGFLLEEVVTELWKERGSGMQNDSGTLQLPENSKVAHNLVLVVCYLYNYGVVHCSLIYEIIRRLLQDFAENDVECLLLILGHCGYSLRSDDPRALKEIVLVVQKRSSEVQKDNKESSARVQYMVSAMMDLKNNIRRKQDVAYSDKTAKLRKLLGRIKSTAAASTSGVRSSDSTLRITLDDILNVDTKGRWWKIGASWVGNQFRHTADDGAHDEEEVGPEEAGDRVKSPEELDEKLLQLASEYRMNTDARRSIFCIIMSSADCEDAYEKLVRAGMLKNRMERETVRVLIECCGNEKAFNKFYALLAGRICEYQPQCKFSLQLAFWDMFKQFDNVKMRKVANLAKLLYHLVAEHGALKLGMLKVLDMSTPNEMSENSLIFLTIFFSSILEHFDDAALVRRLFEAGFPRGRGREPSNKASDADGDEDMDHFDEAEGLRESISAFFIHTLKSSPKNQKGSKFRANLKAAIKACEPDMLDVF